MVQSQTSCVCSLLCCLLRKEEQLSLGWAAQRSKKALTPGVAASSEAQHRAVLEEELKKGQKQWPLTMSLLLGPNDLSSQPSQQPLFFHSPTSSSPQYFQ